ncbi:TetR/AcrR family transcriptional regulator [Sinorhizobium fredii]|uniref:TetR/AcrR family transcriptional regulator n=1 Tax=Rhizobium fredii TaxID=380 RepID=UPI000A664255|nr:TetR/AcrR family transcriptional regulator [Sinorhizobium fredii]WOS66873.1 TetR/AcrR family transcriptional regulator [Sinorhizobium fredii GR64]
MIVRGVNPADPFTALEAFMNYPGRPGTFADRVRARILDVAEEHFHRIGHQKTSMADIAFELGMSRANIYRFFSSKDAISESVCGRILSRAADVAVAIASKNVAALEKLEQILSAVHHYNKMQLAEEKHMHDLVATAAREDWPVIKAHEERMMTILEAIVREDEFEVEDPAETACAVNTAFTPFLHPILIEHSVRRGEDTEAALRQQFRFIQKALGQSAGAADRPSAPLLASPSDSRLGLNLPRSRKSQ